MKFKVTNKWYAFFYTPYHQHLTNTEFSYHNHDNNMNISNRNSYLNLICYNFFFVNLSL